MQASEGVGTFGPGCGQPSLNTSLGSLIRVGGLFLLLIQLVFSLAPCSSLMSGD